MAKISKSRTKRTRKREKESFARQRIPRKNMVLPVVVLLLAWLSAFLMLLGLKSFYSANFLVGQAAPATVVAMTEFECVDLAQTELNRQQAESKVLPVFSVDYSTYSKNMQTIATIFEICSELDSGTYTNNGGIDTAAQRLEELLAGSNIDLELDETMTLVPKGEDAEKVLETLQGVVKNVVSLGIASRKEKEQNFQGVAGTGSIAVKSDQGQIISEKVSELHTPEDAADKAVERIREKQEVELSKKALHALIAPIMRPNLKFNPELTAERKDTARKSVSPRYRKVRKGETIVSIGEKVTPQIDEMLLAHKQKLNEITTVTSKILRRIGQGCILLAVLIVCVGLFNLMRPRPEASPSTLLLMLTLVILVLLSVRGLIYLSATTRLLPLALVNAFFPIALASMLAGLLAGTSIAVVVGVWVSCAAAVMFDNSFVVLMQGLAVTVVGALTACTIRKRSQIFRAGLLVGLVLMFLLVAIGILQNQTLETVVAHSLIGLVNGLVCALLALILVPVFEVAFGRTTDIRLLELSDMGHPLLRRMAIEAPGTYHHSLMVANLAQAAADEIGANSLLVRVSAYYHDIGKLSKPGFFTENIKGDRNPHDDLSPHMSMLVIEAHVKEGLTMAKRHKLPPPIIDAIQEHHASGTMKYFYHRAMKQAESENGEDKKQNKNFDGEHFRYDCPRPRTKEMAILSLADSVEAASRSLEKPNSSRVVALVDQIVETKMKDGQLDECNLTLAELSAIKRSFVFTLTTMQHGRVAYPKDEEKKDENRDSQSAEAEENQQKGDSQNGAPNNGESQTPESRT